MGNIMEADQKISETSPMKCSTYDYDELWVFNMIDGFWVFHRIMMNCGYLMPQYFNDMMKSVLLLEEAGVHRENHQLSTSN